MKLDLHEKVVLLSNANGGIGEAVLCKLSGAGARTMLISKDTRSNYAIESTYKKIRLDGLHSSEVFAEAKNLFGSLDAFIKCPEPRSTFLGQIQGDGLRFAGEAIELAKGCALAMEEQGWGSIINVISAAGVVAIKTDTGLSAASAAIINFTKALALEAGTSKVRVNAVAFGALEKLGDGFEYLDIISDKMLSHVPQGRVGKCEEIAEAVVYLCCKESEYMTGQVLVVDGGWSCGFHRDF